MNINAWLIERCIAYAHVIPADLSRTVRRHGLVGVLERERARLVPYAGRFDGFHAVPATILCKTCVVRFDNNKYSVMAKAVGRPVEVHAYADRVSDRQDGEVAGEHARCYRRDTTRSMTLGTTCRFWRASRALRGMVLRSRIGFCPALRCDPQHPGAPARPAGTDHDRDPGRSRPAPCPRRRLCPL